jgi:hypothetical protein
MARSRSHPLEGFTHAVSAFAVTLLVVSLEVPKTFPELLTTASSDATGSSIPGRSLSTAPCCSSSCFMLELTPIEMLRTRKSLIDQLALARVGLLSALLAQVLPPRGIGLTG